MFSLGLDTVAGLMNSRAGATANCPERWLRAMAGFMSDADLEMMTVIKQSDCVCLFQVITHQFNLTMVNLDVASPLIVGGRSVVLVAPLTTKLSPGTMYKTVVSVPRPL